MSADRLMPAALYLNAAGAKISGEYANACQSLSMQRKDQRGPKLERGPFECTLNCGDAGVVLAKDVPRLGLGSRLRIGDELRL